MLYLDVTEFRNQQVLWLEVAVAEATFMQRIHGSNNLPHDKPAIFVFQLSVLDQVRVQVATRCVLQHHVRRIAVTERTHEPRDARVTQQLQHGHLSDDGGAVAQGGNLRSLDDLYRVLRPR